MKLAIIPGLPKVKMYQGDCLDILPDAVEDESVALAFVDPPYNIGVFRKMPAGEYLEWCERWIALCSRKLKPNGAFWVSHSEPDVLVDISRIIERYGRGRINWVTWDKYNGASSGEQYVMNKTKLHPQGKRSFDQDAEYLIYHADEGEWTAQCDRERGFIFESLRAYLDGERQRAGISKEDINGWLGFRRLGGMAGRHYFSRSQWCLPTERHYLKMRECLNQCNHGGEYLRREYEDLRREYEDLRREYEDLRREYEDLRYTFHNPGKVSSVWQIPPARANGHPTPKPEALLRRIIEATSDPGDLVLDPMAGSGTTAVVCVKTGRDCVAIEIVQKWYELAQRCIAKTQARQLEMAI